MNSFLLKTYFIIKFIFLKVIIIYLLMIMIFKLIIILALILKVIYTTVIMNKVNVKVLLSVVIMSKIAMNTMPVMGKNVKDIIYNPLVAIKIPLACYIKKKRILQIFSFVLVPRIIMKKLMLN